MNQQIVNLRGIAILLVMLGHSIIIYDTTFDLLQTDVQMPIFETAKHLMSLVTMKLFISISGFLLAYKCIKTDKFWDFGFVRSKFIRLLVPYVCVCLLYNDPIKFFLSIPGYENIDKFLFEQLLLGKNCAHLWFLPSLFIRMIISYPLFIWAEKSIWKHVLLIVSFLGIYYYNGYFPETIQLQKSAYYMIYFYLGYLINLMRLTAPQYEEYGKHVKTAIPIFVLVFFIGIIINKITSIGFGLYLPVILVLVFYLYMPSFNNKFINEISKRSYGLYLFHSPLIYFTALYCPNINPWMMLFINFVVFGFIAYCITVLLSHSKLKFIIGER